MTIISDLVAPAELTGFVREVPSPANHVLNQFLPDITLTDIEAEILSATSTNRAATFRVWDAETPIGRRDKIDVRKVQLPPLGEKLVIGEYERIKLEAARLGGNATNALVSRVYDDGVTLTGRVHNRMELARGDVLNDGKFTLAGENGMYLETDYGLAGGHNVAADISWDDHVNSEPFTDFTNWVLTYKQDAGQPAGFALTSSQVVAHILASAQVKDLIGKTFVTPAELNAVLASQGWPQLVPVDTLIETIDPITGADVSKRVIDDDKIIFTPVNPSDLGVTAWGITAEALELVGESNPSIEFEEAPGLVGVVIKAGDPVKRWTKVTAVGMPVIRDISKLFVATVIVNGS